jgi:lipopolysaccharide/colanic/teichoic acid biosynthesis glycosyltransferase
MASTEERQGKKTDSDKVFPTFAAAGRSIDAPAAMSLSASPCGTMRQVTVGAYTLRLPYPSEIECGPLYEGAKRTGDTAAAALLLLLFFPFFLLIALVIFFEDAGPILYYQTRVGKDGVLFRFYKFRSMVRNADAIKAQLEAQNEAAGPIFKMRHDPRVTRVGRVLRKYSLDELPQLVNVLRGEMSLVGPRPHLPKEVECYAERQLPRLRVQPGLLCFREVFGRSNMTFEEWVDLDLLYIQHRSFRTDIQILMRTIPAVLSAEGAC